MIKATHDLLPIIVLTPTLASVPAPVVDGGLEGAPGVIPISAAAAESIPANAGVPTLLWRLAAVQLDHASVHQLEPRPEHRQARVHADLVVHGVRLVRHEDAEVLQREDGPRERVEARLGVLAQVCRVCGTGHRHRDRRL